MSQHMWLRMGVATLLIGTIASLYALRRRHDTAIPIIAQTPLSSPLAKTAYSTIENGKIGVTLSDSWNGTTTNENGLEAIFVTTGYYRLSLITDYHQTSGVIGGEFAEVSPYVSPWTNNLFQPNGCSNYLISRRTLIGNKLERVDLYFDTLHAPEDSFAQCGHPKATATYWYGSYFSEPCRDNTTSPPGCNGYFIRYEDLKGGPVDAPPNDQPAELIYALTYDTNSPSALPIAGDQRLSEIFADATKMVSSIYYK